MPPKSDSNSPAPPPQPADNAQPDQSDDASWVQTIGKVLKMIFQVGGMPLVAVFCGLVFIYLSQQLPAAYTGWCLGAGLLLVIMGVGVSIWEKYRRFGPLNTFSEKLEGYWLELIRPSSSAALSILSVEPNPATGMVRINGTVFNQAGERIAHWESVDSCVNPTTQKLFYYWTGRGHAADAKAQTGFGEFELEFPPGARARGSGRYSDTTYLDQSRIVVKACELRQATKAEAQRLFGDDARVAAAEVQRVLADWK
ncbi:MAG TPA: hypothetical protein VLW52_17590 [Opitutaceae bacterium]|nr:hypothetical protein [Opitutaceae bacterium]